MSGYEITDTAGLNKLANKLTAVKSTSLQMRPSKNPMLYDGEIHEMHVQGEIARLEQKLEEIMQDLQSRNIHLLSKHCWCEPEGHPWTQKGEVL